MTEPLAAVVARGAIYGGISQLVNIAVGLLGTILLARLLAPEDFGVFAMVAPAAALAALLQSYGINQAIIQAPTLRDDERSGAFWVSLTLAAGIAAFIFFAAPWVGAFYDDARTEALTKAVAATVVASALWQTHSALLARNLRFGALAAIEVSSVLVAFLVSLGAAYLLRSFWALWLGPFVASLVATALHWSLGGWHPDLQHRWRAARSMFGFASVLTGYSFLNFLARQADNVIIGSVAGAGPLGFYDRAYRLMTAPISNISEPLARVMLPTLRRLTDRPRVFRSAYVKATWLMQLVLAPIAVTAALTSETLVPFLLGPRWGPAAPIFFWLSIAMVYQPLSNSTGWLFISLRRSKEMLYWGAFSSVTTILSFAYGITEGVVGLARAYVLVSLARLPILYFISTRNSPVRQSDLYWHLFPVAACAASGWAVRSGFAPDAHPALVICAVAMTTYIAAFVAVLLVPSGREAVVRAMEHFGRIVRHRKAAVGGGE